MESPTNRRRTLYKLLFIFTAALLVYRYFVPYRPYWSDITERDVENGATFLIFVLAAILLSVWLCQCLTAIQSPATFIMSLVGISAIFVGLLFALYFVFQIGIIYPKLGERLLFSREHLGYRYSTYSSDEGALGGISYFVRKEKDIIRGIRYTKVLCRASDMPSLAIAGEEIEISCLE